MLTRTLTVKRVFAPMKKNAFDGRYYMDIRMKTVIEST